MSFQEIDLCMTTGVMDIDEEQLEFNYSESEVGSEIRTDATDNLDEKSLCSNIASWCVEFGISEAAGNGLLKILKKISSQSTSKH